MDWPRNFGPKTSIFRMASVGGGRVDTSNPLRKALSFLEDTWGRPLVVIDDKTTNGLMVLTASGPAADISYATTDDDAADRAMTDLYRAFLRLVPRQSRQAK